MAVENGGSIVVEEANERLNTGTFPPESYVSPKPLRRRRSLAVYQAPNTPGTPGVPAHAVSPALKQLGKPVVYQAPATPVTPYRAPATPVTPYGAPATPGTPDEHSKPSTSSDNYEAPATPGSPPSIAQTTRSNSTSSNYEAPSTPVTPVRSSRSSSLDSYDAPDTPRSPDGAAVVYQAPATPASPVQPQAVLPANAPAAAAKDPIFESLKKELLEFLNSKISQFRVQRGFFFNWFFDENATNDKAKALQECVDALVGKNASDKYKNPNDLNGLKQVVTTLRGDNKVTDTRSYCGWSRSETDEKLEEFEKAMSPSSSKVEPSEPFFSSGMWYR
jgi:hypothetical protein